MTLWIGLVAAVLGLIGLVTFSPPWTRYHQRTLVRRLAAAIFVLGATTVTISAGSDLAAVSHHQFVVLSAATGGGVVAALSLAWRARRHAYECFECQLDDVLGRR